MGRADRHRSEDDTRTLQFLGADTNAVELGNTVADDAATPVNEVLADDGYLVLPAPVDAAKAALTLTSKVTKPSGENQPPTKKWTLTAKCGGRNVTVGTEEDEGLSIEVVARQIGTDFVVVELVGSIGREGEYLDTMSAAVLDLKTCAVR